MVSAQPCLCDRGETLVFQDLVWVQMVVEIQDRKIFRYLVIELASCFRVQKKIFVYKMFHGFTSFLYESIR